MRPSRLLRRRSLLTILLPIGPLLAALVVVGLFAARPAPAQTVPSPPPPSGRTFPGPPPSAVTSPKPAPDPDPARAMTRDGKVVMDFDGVDIRTFIKFISELTGKNFVIGDDVRGTVTILSPQSVSKEEAFKVFQSVLEVNGFTLAPAGNLLKIVPSKIGKTMNLERLDQLGETDGDRMVTQVIALKNANAADIKAILAPMISPDGLIADHAETGSLILIDYASNVRRLMDIAQDMDVRQARLTVFKLRHANAKKMAERVTNLWNGATKGKPGARGVTVTADERVNSVAVMASPEETAEIRELVLQLDQPTEKSTGNYKVYALENGNAEEIAKALTELVGTRRTGAAGAAGEEKDKDAPAAGAKIVADKGANSLLVTADPQDFVFFDQLVAKLDRPRRQVYVEALIMEVSAEKAIAFGVSWSAAQLVKPLGDNKNGGLAFGAFQPDGVQSALVDDVLTPGSGLSLGMVTFPVQIGDVVYSNIQAMVTASKTDNNFNIISTPQLLTLDNEEATITVAENRPYLTAKDSGQNELDRTYQTFEYKDVGTTLKVTPQINKGENIRLKVKQEVSRVDKTETLETGALQPTTRKRSTETTVQVRNGQTIVISGLIGENSRDGVDKVPLLGDIPVLGWLFKKKSRDLEKTNLFVFITPRIVQQPPVAEAIFREKVDQLDRIAGEDQDLTLTGPMGPSPKERAKAFSGGTKGAPPVEKPPYSYGPLIRD